jgi:hypothetical protein
MAIGMSVLLLGAFAAALAYRTLARRRWLKKPGLG